MSKNKSKKMPFTRLECIVLFLTEHRLYVLVAACFFALLFTQGCADGLIFAIGAITIALNGTQISSDSSIVFRTNGSTTALTLDASQNATFAGTVTASSFSPSGGGKTLFYGDGSGGAATMDGAATCFGLAPTGGNTYTATANIYATTLTINSGITLALSGCHLFCSVSLTNNGTIHANGNAASGSTAGAASTTVILNGGGAGTNGTTSASTSQAGGNAGAGSIFGGGGGGGRSDGTQQSAGTAATPSTTLLQIVRGGMLAGSAGALNIPYGNPSATSGRGSGDGTNAGGGSGGQASVLFVASKTMTTGVSATYEAKGGTGGNGAAGTAGGGGGGAGGGVVLYADTYAGTALSSSTNVLATGGTGGTGSTTAGNGSNGTDGSVFIITSQ